MKDTRRHYPKDPIIWDVLPHAWETSGTICSKRRAVEYITDNPGQLTCTDCIGNALAYWSEQIITCQSLIEYAEAGRLKGTSAEKESEDLLPKIRVALEEAHKIVAQLKGE